jgi:hypothetical protein
MDGKDLNDIDDVFRKLWSGFEGVEMDGEMNTNSWNGKVSKTFSGYDFASLDK